jgi:hypothetical protein
LLGTHKISFKWHNSLSITAYFNFNEKEGEGSTARNSSARKKCSTPKSRLLDSVQADVKKNGNCSKFKKMSFRADASFRPKWTTA